MANERPYDSGLVRALAGIAAEADLSEVDVSVDGLRVRIARDVSGPRAALPSSGMGPSCAARPGAPPVDAGAEDPRVVRSPMVGTACLRRSPGSAPFAEVGARVSEGDWVLVIVAMRTPSEIVSPRGGTLAAILVRDGEPVEYGQPLFAVGPA